MSLYLTGTQLRTCIYPRYARAPPLSFSPGATLIIRGDFWHTLRKTARSQTLAPPFRFIESSSSLLVDRSAIWRALFFCCVVLVNCACMWRLLGGPWGSNKNTYLLGEVLNAGLLLPSGRALTRLMILLEQEKSAVEPSIWWDSLCFCPQWYLLELLLKLGHNWADFLVQRFRTSMQIGNLFSCFTKGSRCVRE